MKENEQVRLGGKPPGGVVCAHIGVGASDEQAKLARDRLANALDVYRRRSVVQQQQ